MFECYGNGNGILSNGWRKKFWSDFKINPSSTERWMRANGLLIESGNGDLTKVDCFVKTRKFDLIDIIAEALKFVVSLSN